MDLTPALAYIEGYWPQFIRWTPRPQATRIGLPRPYLVPSPAGSFQDLYYWDSFFMALGLVGTAYEPLIVDLTENLASLFQRFGIIPNASRYYSLSRSQPPFFTELIWLAHDVKRRQNGDAGGFLRRMMRLAEREHETVWLGTVQPHVRQVFEGLSRYFDINFLDELASYESGWNFSTRCGGRWLEHLPVDLNAILYRRELDFAAAAETLGAPDRARPWRDRAARRAEAMTRLMWDEEQGFFFDYDWINGRRTLTASLAGFYPLWAGLATPEQAARVVRDWLPQFEYPGGLVATTQGPGQPIPDEPLASASSPGPGRFVFGGLAGGRRWAYPNGWAPLHWLVVSGLERYGYEREARHIRSRWCETCARVFEMTGAMWDRYNVVEPGEPPDERLHDSVQGFGWTNGVFSDFARRLSEGGRASELSP